MEMAEVLTWNGITRLDIPVSRVLKSAKDAKLSDCIIIGWDKDGEPYFASSMASGPDTLWLIELCKKRLMEMGDNHDKLPPGIEINAVINPFDQKLQFDLISAVSGKANIELVNLQGTVIKRKDFTLNDGLNNLSVSNTDILPAGIYILRVEFNGRIVQRKIVKIH